MTEAKPKRKRTPAKKGRPVGAKTADRDAVDVVETRCRCGSTARAPYDNSRTVEGEGVAPDGEPYTEVILSPTHCLACGQHRVDRRYRNVPQQNG